MAYQKVFISHAHENAELAESLKNLIEDAFSNVLELFVASDSRSLPPGARWRQRIEEMLQQADGFVLVITPQSIDKRWVNFEAGAALARDKHLIPVCARGLKIEHVGDPLNRWQLLEIYERAGVQAMLDELGRYYRITPKPKRGLVNEVLRLAAPRDDDLPPPLTSEEKANEPVTLRQMRTEWDALAPARQTFWKELRRYYVSNFRGKPSYSNDIDLLADDVEPPKGLPLLQGKDLRDYPSMYGRQLAGSDSLLYEFCGKVYPPKQPNLELEDCSSIKPKQSFADFHKARGDLARFWNRWGQAAYSERRIGLDTIVHSFSDHHRILKILSHLEIALVQWTQDKGVGKQWLFRLARDWRKLNIENQSSAR